jgi:hypothetical protein
MRKPAQTNMKFTPRLSVLLLIGGLLLGCGPQPSNNPPVTSVPQVTATEAMTAPPATNLPTSPTAPAASQATAEAPSAAATDVATPDGTAPIHETGDAVVENIEIRILESFPVQVQALLTGYLPDGCTTITGSEVVTAGTTFRIRLATERPEDAICTQAIVNFEEVVPLDVSEMPAGTYQVAVNDLWATFELPGSGAEAAPGTDAGANAAGAYPVVETPVGYILAQADVPIRSAPVEDGSVIGMVAGGMTARVTGASQDAAWWRIICPDDSVGDCWVSAAPNVTTPTTPPG